MMIDDQNTSAPFGSVNPAAVDSSACDVCCCTGYKRHEDAWDIIHGYYDTKVGIPHHLMAFLKEACFRRSWMGKKKPVQGS
ncbi:hypothetical protein MUK42_34852 [Musa troglodytarum]|uniref:Uncharacterized protein n=1 Tax=Musa troglodytarum TaxID=320322 RepID=A0A9E7J9X1_9LILI|nr:hypothetical protein MUK42_34852 [Musa troglodytarum]